MLIPKPANPSPSLGPPGVPTAGLGAPPFLNAAAEGANRIGVPTLGDPGMSSRRAIVRGLLEEKELGGGDDAEGGEAGRMLMS